MKIVIHDLMKDSNKLYEGDVVSIERELERDFPEMTEHRQGHLDDILWHIDHHPFFAVEVVSSSLHPFFDVKVPNE